MPYTSPLQLPPSAPLPPHLDQTQIAPEANSIRSLFHPVPNERGNTHSFSHHHPYVHTQHPTHSYSSQSYFRRHRRSPSYSKASLSSVGEGLDNGGSTNGTSRLMTVDPHASLRQSPPLHNNAIIPLGAVISPPESAGNSSDDEVSPTNARSVDPIEAAIRSLEAQRKTEDETSQDEKKQGGKYEIEHREDIATTNIVPSLSPEARRISHSRSSTESSVSILADSIESSSNESDRDEEIEGGPKTMVRKKSGELVRPALRSKRRPSSMPGTPTFSKNVHFDSKLEHIRHFLQLDKPLEVSANTSPVERYTEEHEYPFNKKPGPEWEIKMPNFPTDSAARKHRPVRLERVFLSSDQKNLVGVVSVANLAFHKHVAARFTVDHWKTVSEVTAEYNNDIRRKQANDGYDRFDFSIKLSDITNLESKTLFICIRYLVNGHEFWDNNDSINYQVQFTKLEKTHNGDKKQPLPTTTRDHGRPLPRSRNHPSTMARPRSMPPSSFDDFGPPKSNFSASYGTTNRNPESDFRLTVVDSHDLFEAPKPREKPARQAFGSRYDFGLSLSAAKSSGATEDRTTLSAKAKSMSSRGESSTAAHAHPARDGNISPPSGIVSNKPHLESSTYKELVDKYCFFGSAKNTSANSSKSTSGSASPDEKSRVDSGVAMNLPSSEKQLDSNSGYHLNPLYRGRMSPSGFLSESQPAAILG